MVGVVSRPSLWRRRKRSVRVHAERKKVFAVTGGTGFLGTHLVQRLVRDGHAVRMLVRSDPGDALRESGGMCVRGDDDVVESVYGSLENDNDVRELLLQQRRDDEGMYTKEDEERVVVDGVYHLAGLVVHSRRRNVVEELQCVNVDGAVRVVRIAMELGVARACIVSTSGTVAVRADASISADDESNGDGMHTYAELARRWPYYKSKIDMEQAVSTMTKTMEGECPVTEIVMVRPSLLLGPGDRRLSSCKTVADLLKRRLSPASNPKTQSYVRQLELLGTPRYPWRLKMGNCSWSPCCSRVERTWS